MLYMINKLSFKIFIGHQTSLSWWMKMKIDSFCFFFLKKIIYIQIRETLGKGKKMKNDLEIKIGCCIKVHYVKILIKWLNLHFFYQLKLL